VTLRVPPNASASFHGRDVFAPAAAALATGASLQALGTPAATPLIRRTPEPRRRHGGVLIGEVISVDRFGNAITNLLGLRAGVVEVGTAMLAVRRTYADVPIGSPLAIVGSTGLIEIAVREGSGARHFGLTRGSEILFRATDA
jgi:S-adenosylmethionine hydrolase